MSLDDEFLEGYRDGQDMDCPEPSGNRSEAYRHSFEVARREKLRLTAVPASVSRQKTAEIIARG